MQQLPFSLVGGRDPPASSFYSTQWGVVTHQATAAIQPIYNLLVCVSARSDGQADASKEDVLAASDLAIDAGFDHLNVHALIEFCERSRLPQKLAHFRPAAGVEVQRPSAAGVKSFLGQLAANNSKRQEPAAEPRWPPPTPT